MTLIQAITEMQWEDLIITDIHNTPPPKGTVEFSCNEAVQRTCWVFCLLLVLSKPKEEKNSKSTVPFGGSAL